MKTSEFDFSLLKELIAREPVSPRDKSRLLMLDRARQKYADHIFAELPDLLDSNSVLVFNRSKVIPARLRFKYEDKEVEILLVRETEPLHWTAMVYPAKRFYIGAEFLLPDGFGVRVIDVLSNGMRKIIFIHCPYSLQLFIKRHGQTPFPPYLKGTKARDRDYQTVFARDEGSIAAPTAGLHFTKRLLDRLHKKNIQMEFLTLHVGPGTFLPVKAENLEEHKMHSEYFVLDEKTCDRLNQAKKEGKKIIAVGTTSTRVLESCTKNGFLKPKSGETDLFIHPGYKWKIVDGLITNFHLPKSTLLMLVSAFAGKDFVMKAYKHAIEKRYRFYSFGDAMLIL